MDDKVDKLNKKISKLLGKKEDSLPNLNNQNNDEDDGESISNGVYLAITLVCIIFLWLSSGVYYVGEGQYGIIMSNGKVSQVITGPRMGITLPLPISNVELIDGDGSDMHNIGVTDMDNSFQILSKDAMPISINAQYAYKIVDPVKFYNSIYNRQNNIDNFIRLNTLSAVHLIFNGGMYAILKNSNFTILSQDILKQANQMLSVSGIELVKFSINKLYVDSRQDKSQNVDEHNLNMTNNIIAQRLIEEAKNYREEQLSQAHASLNSYNQLLNEYKNGPEPIAKQMYYDTVAYINNVQTNKYSYLFLSLPQLYNAANKDSGTYSRGVVRERVYGR